jgi:hypothetical protein
LRNAREEETGKRRRRRRRGRAKEGILFSIREET